MKFTIDENHLDERLDFFITTLDGEKISRSYAKTLIENGNVKVNQKASKGSYKLKSNDEVEVDLPEPELVNVVAENIPLDIVYEDDHLIVVNKPIGMVTHPAPGTYTGTLVNAVLYHVQEQAKAGKSSGLSDMNGVLRPGIVHRLDKDTSGLIVVAKSNEAHQSLSTQIQDRTCSRVYNCIVHDNIKEDQGVINKPIGRNPVERHKMTTFEHVNIKNNSRDARTRFKVLERFLHKGKTYTLVECKLDTVRTHQIRVHMSWMKRPIVGDFIYSAPEKIPFKVNRPMLHAVELSFNHPITGEELTFKSTPTEDFQRILTILRGI